MIAFGMLLVLVAPPSAEVQADRLVEVGRTAWQAGKRDAAERAFRSTLDRFGGTPAANAARYGLALGLASGPNPDYAKAAELAEPPAQDGNFPDRAAAAHLLGRCHRAVGLAGPVADAPNRFERARQAFETARNAAQQTGDVEAAAQARCDMAEMELRRERPNEARAQVDAFLTDAEFKNLACRPVGLYLHGLASVQLKDAGAAVKALEQCAPFRHPVAGAPAEYLLGRLRHDAGELAAAQTHYAAVVARPEAAGKSVAGAAFQLATLKAEAGQFAASLPVFDTFSQTYPNSHLAAEAHLRAGICLVQLKQPADAAKRLAVLIENKKLADQVYLWLGKAAALKAVAGDRDAIKTAQDFLKRAADLAQQNGNDPDHRARRQDALLTLAACLYTAKQYRPAAELFEQVWNEGGQPNQRDRLLACLVVAWGQSSEPDRSRWRVDEFKREFPDSPFLPDVLMQAGANALRQAADSVKHRHRPADIATRFSDAAGLFAEVADRFPNHAAAPVARFEQGLAAASAGSLADATKAFEAVPARVRTGRLATTPVHLADALLRVSEPNASVALAGKATPETLVKTAVTHLEAFLKSHPTHAEVPAALLRLGQAQHRLGQLGAARATLEKLPREPSHAPVAAAAQAELALVIAATGDRAEAIRRLRPFTTDGHLARSAAAPTVLLHLGQLLQADLDPTEAAKLLGTAINRHEPHLRNEPAGMDLVHRLKLQQARALVEAEKPAAAFPLFDQVMQQCWDKPIGADATREAEQARATLATAKLEKANEQLKKAGKNNDRINAANRDADQARQELRQSAERLERRANDTRDRLGEDDARLRLYLHAALIREQVAGAMPDGDNDRRQAAAALRQASEQGPSSAVGAVARLKLADQLAAEGDSAAAIELLRAAAPLDPSARLMPPILALHTHLRLGKLLADTGDWPGAAARYAAAANLPAPADLTATAHYLAADADLMRGAAEPAITRLRAFQDQPAFQNVPAISEWALMRLGQAYLARSNLPKARATFQLTLDRFGAEGAFAPEAHYAIGLTLQTQDIAAANRELDRAAANLKTSVAAQALVRRNLNRVAEGQPAAAAAGLLAVPYLPMVDPDVSRAARLEAANALARAGQPSEAIAILQALLADAAGTRFHTLATERLNQLRRK